MKRFALLGHPLAGSLSPALFRAAYGGRWNYELVDTPSFDEAWAALLASYDGVNVTAPFKVDALRRCDILSDDARRSGAVNLVLRSNGKCLGYNTDVEGVRGALQCCPEVPEHASVLVVGTGGAARAALTAALQMGFSATVAGRSPEKVQTLAPAFGCTGALLSEITDYRPDIVIYTLPGSAPVPSGLPLAGAIVLEAEYRQPALAGVPCRAYVGGLRWLLCQAVAGYRLFTGEEPDRAAMEDSLNG